MQLKRVVFPEPFGPIIPWISLSLISMSTLSKACRAPKLLDKPLIFSIMNPLIKISRDYQSILEREIAKQSMHRSLCIRMPHLFQHIHRPDEVYDEVQDH